MRIVCFHGSTASKRQQSPLVKVLIASNPYPCCSFVHFFGQQPDSMTGVWTTVGSLWLASLSQNSSLMSIIFWPVAVVRTKISLVMGVRHGHPVVKIVSFVLPMLWTGARRKAYRLRRNYDCYGWVLKHIAKKMGHGPDLLPDETWMALFIAPLSCRRIETESLCNTSNRSQKILTPVKLPKLLIWQGEERDIMRQI